MMLVIVTSPIASVFISSLSHISPPQSSINLGHITSQVNENHRNYQS